MGVKLRKKVNGSGSTSLYLEIYNNGKRVYEFLPDLKLRKPQNPTDRLVNKNNLELAQKIAINRAKELIENEYDLKKDGGKWVQICFWMQGFIDNYKKKDKRNLQGALNKFKIYLSEENLSDLTFGKINEQLLIDFQDYLRHICKGEGASSYFNRFKKMIRAAYRNKLLPKDLAAEVKTISGFPRRKEVLSLEEIAILYKTPISNEEIKRAFLFSCLTGLRWVDVKTLKWGQINLIEKRVVKKQEKTQKDVSITLNESALMILGESKSEESLVFELPTHNGANKTVKAWVKRANIKKNITWHNARHSFGTNLIINGIDTITTANLLGHTSLKYITNYVKIAKELKERATDTLNIKI